jgi:hypothetical protein
VQARPTELFEMIGESSSVGFALDFNRVSQGVAFDASPKRTDDN